MTGTVFLNRNFFLLWMGKLVSQIGDRFYSIAMAWWILEKTDSPAAMGFFMVVSILPGLVFGIFCGPYVDRCSRKFIIVSMDIVRGVVVVAVAALSAAERLELWEVAAAAVVISLASAFFNPAVQAVVPGIVSREQLPRANALNQLVGGVCNVLGPLLGAAAVGFFGFTWVFFINGISYLLSAFSELFMEIPRVQGVKAGGSVLKELGEGFTFLRGRKQVFIIILVIGVAHFFVGCLSVSIPFLARELNGNGLQNLSYLQVMIGLGLVLGALYINFRSKGVVRETHLFLFLAAAGFCLAGTGMLKGFTILSVLPYMGLLFIFGVAIANASVYWESLLQANTPDAMAGRVFSLSSLTGNASMPLAFAVFGVLLNHVALALLLVISGVCLIGFSVFLLSISGRRTGNNSPARAEAG